MRTDTTKDLPADGLSAGGESQVSLDELASGIRDEYAQVRTSFGNAFQHALAAGRLLNKAKLAVLHGSWLPWLDENCKLSEREAQNYMRLAERATPLLEGDPQRVADLSVRGALALLAKPKSPKIDTDKSQGLVRSEQEPLNKIKALVKKLEQHLRPDCVLFLWAAIPTDPDTAALVDQLVASSERLGCRTRVSEGAWMFMRSKGCTDAPLESPASVSTMVHPEDEVNLD